MRTITAPITSYVSGKAFGFVGADPSKLVTAVTKGAAAYASSVWTEGTATITRAVYVTVVKKAVAKAVARNVFAGTITINYDGKSLLGYNEDVKNRNAVTGNSITEYMSDNWRFIYGFYVPYS